MSDYSYDYSYDETYEKDVEFGGQCTLEIATPEEMGYNRADWNSWSIAEKEEMLTEYFNEFSDQ